MRAQLAGFHWKRVTREEGFSMKKSIISVMAVVVMSWTGVAWCEWHRQADEPKAPTAAVRVVR